jgi:hypothetical protein
MQVIASYITIAIALCIYFYPCLAPPFSPYFLL